MYVRLIDTANRTHEDLVVAKKLAEDTVKRHKKVITYFHMGLKCPIIYQKHTQYQSAVFDNFVLFLDYRQARSKSMRTTCSLTFSDETDGNALDAMSVDNSRGFVCRIRSDGDSECSSVDIRYLR